MERGKAHERGDEVEQIQSQSKDVREADKHAKRVADEVILTLKLISRLKNKREERRRREGDIELEERGEAEKKIQAEESLEAEQREEEELGALYAKVQRMRSHAMQANAALKEMKEMGSGAGPRERAAFTDAGHREVTRTLAKLANESTSIGPADTANSETKQRKSRVGGLKTVQEPYFLFLGGASTVISLGTILPHCVLCPVVAISLVGAIVQRMVPRRSWVRTKGPGEMHKKRA
jgi:hypothetical protein